jgi:hypothetical protein
LSKLRFELTSGGEGVAVHVLIGRGFDETAAFSDLPPGAMQVELQIIYRESETTSNAESAVCVAVYGAALAWLHSINARQSEPWTARGKKQAALWRPVCAETACGGPAA